MPAEKVQGRKQFLSAVIDTATINVEARTADVVFVTENEVMMYDWQRGLFREILDCNDAAGDLTRLNNGGAVCDSHNTYALKNGLGVVERAWFENGKGRATLRFSKRADVEPVWQDIVDKIVRNVSVGYVVYSYDITEETGKLPLYRATKWEALEITMCLVQADKAAGVGRSVTTANELHEVTLIRTNSNKNTMPETTGAAGNEPQATSTNGAAAQPAKPVTATDGGEGNRSAGNGNNVNVADVTKAERSRIAEIQATCRSVGITDEKFIAGLVGDENTAGLPIGEARTKIIDKVAEMKKGNQTQTHNVGITINADETDKRRSAQITALCLRGAQVREKSFKEGEVSAAREFRTMSLMDMARESLVRSGDYNWESVMREHPMEIAKRAITSSTSDFPVMLEGTARRTLLDAYNTLADTWREFCAVGSVGDFRPYWRVRQDALAGKLDKVPENGEYKTKALPDGSKESVSVDTFGNLVNMSRKMIINDDLGAFTKTAARLGRLAARSIELDVFALLAANPNMSDGNALFSSAHANLITSGGAAPSVAGMAAMRLMLGTHKDNAGETIALRPDLLLVGLANRDQAALINEAQYNPDVSNKYAVPNTSRGMYRQIVDTPYITGTEYYMFANPNIEPVIEVNFLNGIQEPYLESRDGFNVDGVEWKVRLDYGVDAVGWLGAVKNPGA